jgi:YegS/Rv2252/BmrU family lipid kinase
MQNVVVANPRAAAGRVRTWWEAHQSDIELSLGSVDVRFTEGPRHATELTRIAIHDGCKRIIAVGGDGTVNEVVNGFFDGKELIRNDVALVVYPAGTGGDFVRSVGMVDLAIEEALAQAEPRQIDVGRAVLTHPDGKEALYHFVNVSSFGSSGLIVDKVNKSTKALGGKASFYMGTLRGMMAYRNQPVRIRIDNNYDEEHVINTVAVANGRYFGGSMMIAPQAIVDDGLLDVVMLGDIGVATFLRHSGKIYKGKHLSQGWPWASSHRGRVVEVTPLGPDPVLVDLDGEQPGRLPVRYEVLPAVLNLLAPWRRAEAIHQV